MLTQEHIAAIEEAAQTLESAAKYNREMGRTVFAHSQQAKADKLREVISAVAIPAQRNPMDPSYPPRKIASRVPEAPPAPPTRFVCDSVHPSKGYSAVSPSDSTDAARYRAWRSAVLTRDEAFVDAVRNVIPVADDDLTATKWDEGIDAAIAASKNK
jgi:hypothetical protein